MIRRCTKILLLTLGLAAAACGAAQVPNDEVTTRLNARDKAALGGDASPDAGPPADARTP